MTTLRLSILFLITSHFSCAQETSSNKPERQRVNPEAVVFNNKAMELVPFLDNHDSCKKALLLLEKSTTIDSNYFLGHFHKLMFYYRLEQFDKALLTANKLVQLKPHAHDMHMLNGFLYEKQNNPISAEKHFKKSLEICNSVLDTIKIENRDYTMLLMNKGITMIMLNNYIGGQKVLKELYDSQSEEVWRETIAPFMNKSNEELVAMITNPDYR